MVPNILKSSTTIGEWENRRKEILSLFEEYEYGKNPEFSFDEVKLSLNERLELQDSYIMDTYGLVFIKGSKYSGLQYTMLYKKDSTHCPAIVHINPFSSNPIGYMRNATAGGYSEVFPMKLIVDEGYVAIDCHVDKICADDPETYKKGILEFASIEGDNGWSALGIWAWATSRIIDQLGDNPIIDKDRIAISGCSRAGKAALWCGAQDTRVAAVFASVSGCCGAAMHRGKSGETIEKITEVFPHWSCKRFKEYRNREDDLPMDQHMLLALIAPRPLYISSASLDDWAHPEKEFESCVRVSELYAAMGKKGLSSSEFPNPNTPIKDGDIGYHLRDGEHGCKLYDWYQVLSFFDRYF